METLTVTLSGERLTFSRKAFLGATNLVVFAGDAAETDGLTLYVTFFGGRIALAQSATEQDQTTIAFDAEELIREYRGCSGETIGFSAWLAGPSGTVGHGTLNIQWSPLVVDIVTGHAAVLKGDSGTGIEGVSQNGNTVTLALTDGTTHEISLAGLKGDKGDAGSALNEEASALATSMPDFDPETAKFNDLYTQIGILTEIIKAMNQ